MIPSTATLFSQLFRKISHPSILVNGTICIELNPAAMEYTQNNNLPIQVGMPLPESLSDFLIHSTVGNCEISGSIYDVNTFSIDDSTILVLQKLQKDSVSPQLLASITNKLQDSITPLIYACHLITPLLEETKNPQATRYISIFNQNCYRLIRVINTLSAFEKASKSPDDVPPLENLDIALLCRRVAEQTVPLAKLLDITLRQEGTEGCHIIRGSAPDFECMLYHLFSNAMKFTPAGGEILLHMKVTQGMVYISVVDNGSGIPEHILNTVFARFQKEHGLTETQAGLGLGLTLVRKTAALCGGTVALTSKKGETRVTVSLPNRKNEETILCSPKAGPEPGGFSNALVELSDALPSSAFYPQDIE